MNSLRKKANSFIGVPIMQYGVSILKIFSLIVLTRSLNTDGFGDYSYITTVATLLITITYAGGQTIGLRLFSQTQFGKDQVYTYLIRTGLYASICSVLLFPLFIYFSNTDLKNLNIWIILVAIILLTPSKILTQVHNAFNKQNGNYVKIKSSEFISTLIFIILLVLLYIIDILNIELAILLFITQSVLLLLLVKNKYKNTEVSTELKRKFKKDFKKLYPSGLFAYVVSSSDIIMLGLLSNSLNVGIYAVAVRIYSMMTMFPSSINLFFSNRIGENAFFEKGEFARYSRITLTLCIIGAVAVIIIAKYIILFVAGEEYFDSIQILKILSIAFIFRSVSYIFTAKWVHLEKYAFLSMVSSINGTTNIVLNLIFIPLYGAIAAAWTSLFSYSIGFLINLYLLISERPENSRVLDYFLINTSDFKLLYNKYVTKDK
jgi:O-antigen/teichoic acid export membrane protein